VVQLRWRASSLPHFLDVSLWLICRSGSRETSFRLAELLYFKRRLVRFEATVVVTARPWPTHRLICPRAGHVVCASVAPPRLLARPLFGDLCGRELETSRRRRRTFLSRKTPSWDRPAISRSVDRRAPRECARGFRTRNRFSDGPRLPRLIGRLTLPRAVRTTIWEGP